MRPFFGWLRKHRTSVIFALSLGLLVFSAWYLLAPTSLTIAVMRPDSSYRETAQALEHGDVDLALVRPDFLYPANGLTSAVMREEALMIVAPSAQRYSIATVRLSIQPSSSNGIHFSEHLDDDGVLIFKHACHLRLEGIVSSAISLPLGRSSAGSR